MMTKKDFVRIADGIKYSPADRDYFIQIIVDIAKDSNPLFNEEMFRKACGQWKNPACGCWLFQYEGADGKTYAESWNTGTQCHGNEHGDMLRCPLGIAQQKQSSCDHDWSCEDAQTMSDGSFFAEFVCYECNARKRVVQ